MDKMRNEDLIRRTNVREEVSYFKWIEKICSGLDIWSVLVGADDLNSVWVKCGR